VVDEAGKPVAGAKVETLTNPADYRTARTEERRSWSGTDGRFALRQLPAGRVHKVMASKEGYAPANRIADSTAPVLLVLRHGTVAAGRVVDEQGRPVEGVELILHPADQDPTPRPALRFRTVSDAQGRFRLANVSAGRFDLRATRPGFAEADLRGILIAEGEPRADLGEITLLPGAAIEGIVVDERDRPVQGAEVELTPFGPSFDARFFFREPVQTGPDGRFRIADLPRGAQVALKATHRDLAPAEMAGVEAPTAEPVRLRLTRPRSLEGRVRDRQGEPVAAARDLSAKADPIDERRFEMRPRFAFLVSLILGGLLITAPARADSRDTARTDETPAVVMPGSIASLGVFIAKTVIAKTLTEQRHATAKPVEPPSALLKRFLPWIDHSTTSSSERTASK
jgi:protocatechuate 3,4-dioxygenase beta subunit